MGKKTTISWTATNNPDGSTAPGATWNPWYGCLKVSPGCKNCYMYRDMTRYKKKPNIVTRAKPGTFNSPLKWKERKKVFLCSWSDFFIEEADLWRDETWDIIRKTLHLTYQILTKRPERIKHSLPEDWGDGWPNVWLGVSVETSDYLWRIIPLEDVPAVVKFVSYEPALEYVDFTTYSPTLDWIISGGESGPNCRPAQLSWFRQVRDDCVKNDIAYFHKQHGGSRKIDGDFGGRELDGVIWSEFPAHKIKRRLT